MKRFLILTLAICSVFFFVSCQKDNSATSNSNNSDINGDWKFVSLDVSTKSTVQYSDGGTAYKTITTSNYKTLDNSGDVKIDGEKVTTSNLTYRISSTAHGEFYEDGDITDSLDFPFDYTGPAYNSVASYKKIGSDSLYFDSGSFIEVQTGTTTPGQPNGVKYKLENNKLVLYSASTQTKTDVQQGIPTNVKNEAVISINLEKK
ncbi:MAG: hypothetical protein ABUT20_07620 [Bacteroidota bacterium]